MYNLDNQEVGHYTLPGTIFGVPIRRDILHRVVRWQLAKRQQACPSSTSLWLPDGTFGTFVSISNCATNKELCCLNRELTKQRHELRCQGVEGSLDHRKDKGKPELALSELDRLHPISAACVHTSAAESACLKNCRGLMLGYFCDSNLPKLSQFCHCKHAGLHDRSCMSLQMRGGGVIHGPVVRSHEHSLNRKVRRLGMKCALAVSDMQIEHNSLWSLHLLRSVEVVMSFCRPKP